jgi:adenosylcobinamide-GDP ribazoletransferase
MAGARGHWLRQWRALGLALGLLSRFPVPRRSNPDSAAAGHALHWYPLAGLLIALPCLLLSLWLPAPTLLSAVLVLALWVTLTGALHLDGLADCADAWIGGMGDRERSLAIMRDPACGPAGVVALLLLLLLKLAALEALLRAGFSSWWLVPVWARALLPLAFLSTPYVRRGGMGSGLAQTASRPGIALAVACVLALSASCLTSGLWWLWLLSAAAVLLCWRRAMLRRLGGFTGDGAGALVEVAEAVLLLVAAVAVAAP